MQLSTRAVRAGINSHPAPSPECQTRYSHRVVAIARYLTAAAATMTARQLETFHTVVDDGLSVVQAADVALALSGP
jgi:hypothetical protein